MINSEQLIKALDFSENIMVITDKQGIIQYVNQTFVDKYGYTRNEAIGKNPGMLNTGYHDAAFYYNLWTTISNGETWKGTFRNQTKSGQIIWEHATINPIIDDKSYITGYIAIKEDVTRQVELEKQLEEDQFFLEELFNNAPVGIAILEPVKDSNGKVSDLLVIKSNPNAGKIVGKLGMVGLSLSEVLPSVLINQARLNTMLTQMHSFEAYLDELNKHLRFRSFPFGDQKLCVFYYDVTPYKQTIDALQVSEERYFTLVEDAPAMICRFDKDGILSYVNNQYCQVYGVTQEELLGSCFYDMVPSEDREFVIQNVKKLTPEHPINEYEHRVVLSNGMIRWQRWIDRALINTDEGKIVEYQSVGMDFTQLKETESALLESKNKLQSIVHNTVVGIGVVNQNGRYILVNSRFLDMMGFESEEEVYHLTDKDITHPDSMDVSGQYLKKLVAGEINEYNIEKKYIRKDGSVFWGELYASPMRRENGKVTEIVGIITDINQKKQYEIQLKENEQKLKELNTTKDKLFSIIAHDVKNPFNAILGFSALLKNNLDSYSKEEIRSYVNNILAGSENVYKLLDDLLIWAKTQLGQIQVNKKHFNVHGLVENAFESFIVHANTKNVALVNDVPKNLILFADYEMLRFVIRNLVHNGIKFSNDPGKVKCSALKIREGGKPFLELLIKDSGIGIRPEKLAILFNVGEFMATSGTSEEKGSGLGLHLAYDLIEKSGGFIDVKSEVGHGTEFVIRIPME
ncbi:MAG: PAS domain S-box protein [Marinilabiliaceae bacterium]|nr:PAS domain S-box protein [Marinilabiliaceae bacterium]